MGEMRYIAGRGEKDYGSQIYVLLKRNLKTEFILNNIYKNPVRTL
jgi:hypothetical protein